MGSRCGRAGLDAGAYVQREEAYRSTSGTLWVLSVAGWAAFVVAWTMWNRKAVRLWVAVTSGWSPRNVTYSHLRNLASGAPGVLLLVAFVLLWSGLILAIIVKTLSTLPSPPFLLVRSLQIASAAAYAGGLVAAAISVLVGTRRVKVLAFTSPEDEPELPTEHAWFNRFFVLANGLWVLLLVGTVAGAPPRETVYARAPDGSPVVETVTTLAAGFTLQYPPYFDEVTPAQGMDGDWKVAFEARDRRVHHYDSFRVEWADLPPGLTVSKIASTISDNMNASLGSGSSSATTEVIGDRTVGKFAWDEATSLYRGYVVVHGDRAYIVIAVQLHDAPEALADGELRTIVASLSFP